MNAPYELAMIAHSNYFCQACQCYHRDHDMYVIRAQEYYVLPYFWGCSKDAVQGVVDQYNVTHERVETATSTNGPSHTIYL